MRNADDTPGHPDQSNEWPSSNGNSFAGLFCISNGLGMARRKRSLSSRNGLFSGGFAKKSSDGHVFRGTGRCIGQHRREASPNRSTTSQIAGATRRPDRPPAVRRRPSPSECCGRPVGRRHRRGATHPAVVGCKAPIAPGRPALHRPPPARRSRRESRSCDAWEEINTRGNSGAGRRNGRPQTP